MNGEIDGKKDGTGKEMGMGEGGGRVKVVFVSFLRDWEFWRREGARLVRPISRTFYYTSAVFSFVLLSFSGSRRTSLGLQEEV